MPLWNTTPFNAALFGGPAVLQPGFVPRQVGKGLLYPALRKAAITIGPQRTPSPAQFQDAIEELNRLTGSLNCDRLFIYSIARDEYPLDPPKMTYTIGLPADPLEDVDFVTQRPQLIESANIVDSTGAIRYPLALITDLQWARIGYQTLQNTIPEALYNDRASPVSTLYLYGQPASGQILELFTWTQVPFFQNLTDEVLLPIQYEDALVLNLAVRLAPHFQRIIPDDVRLQARESLMRLESLNAPQPIAELPGWLYCGSYGASSAFWGASGGGGGGTGGGSGGTVGPPGPQGPAGAAGPQGPPLAVQDEGAALTQRAFLNFVGAGVAASDDAGNNRTLVTIPGGGAGSDFVPRTLSGTKDGTNVTFTVSVALTSFQLFRNGVLQVAPGDYTFTTGTGLTTITFSVWPPASDDLLALWG